MSIGKRLRELRNNEELTLEEVSKLLGLTRQTLQKYEKGVITNIPFDKIEQLAKIYNTTPAFIMGWEDEAGTIKYDYLKDEKAFNHMSKLFLDNIEKSFVEEGITINREAFTKKVENGLKTMIEIDAIENGFKPIATHHDGEDWTEEELEDIEMYKELIRKRREKRNRL